MWKYILILLFCNTAMAFDVPSYLKDSTITVTLKNGKEYKYSGNEWMVVRRHAKVCPISGESGNAPALVVASDKPTYKNRVRVMGGVGPNGFNPTIAPSAVSISTTDGVLGGVGYDRMIDERWSIGGQAFTNRTYTLGIGLDF